jgi:hypothetical protein
VTLRSVLTVALLSTLLGVASCAPVTPNAQQEATDTTAGAASFTEVVTDYKTAIGGKDYGRMVALVLSPAMLDQLVVQFDPGKTLSRKKVEEQVRAILKKTMAAGNLLQFAVDASKSEIQTSPTGRHYALVPASVVVEGQGARARGISNYLAVEDGGRWYLLSPSNPKTIQTIKSAYPDLADVALSVPSIEMISQ